LLSGFLFPSSSELADSVPVVLSVLLLFPVFGWYRNYRRKAGLSQEVNQRARGAVVLWIFALFFLAMTVRFPSVLWFRVPYEKTPLVYLVVLTMVLVEKTKVSAFGLKKEGMGKALLFGLAYFAVFSFFPVLVFNLLTYLSLNQLLIQSCDFSSFLLVMPFMMCVGVSEESLFRGYVQTHLERFYSQRKANLFQGLLFGFWHIVWYVSTPDPLYMAGYVTTTFVIGLFYGYFYSKARNLVPLIITHGLHNSLFRGAKLNQTVVEIIISLPWFSQLLLWLTPFILVGVLAFAFTKYVVREL
jgi:membrane protease YdiL (CAAX protease family)